MVTGFLSGVKACTLNNAVTSGANKVTQKIILAVSAVAVVDIACIVVDTPLECMNFPESSYAKKVRASYLHLAPA